MNTKTLSRALSLLSALVAGLMYSRPRPPLGIALMIPKVLAGSISALAAIAGILGAILSAVSRRPVLTAIGLTGAAYGASYVAKISAKAPSFSEAFGTTWEGRISQEAGKRLPKSPRLFSKGNRSDYQFQQNMVYATIPGADRPLLCDLWQPAQGAHRSGLVFIYAHGGAWHIMDKDFGTRFFFRHLVSQGHVVMDIAYRLAPETDVFGMVGDVKRAIVWIKQNAFSLGIDPSKIVVSGASAGGHLALLTAYTYDIAELTPADVGSADCTVRGVVSYYGPTDLRIRGSRFSGSVVDFLERDKGRPIWGAPAHAIEEVIWRSMFRVPITDETKRGSMVETILADMLGTPDPVEQEPLSRLISPITHVSPNCPATMLLHGIDDTLVPVADARALYQALRQAGVPAVYLELPHTEHAFDLFLPRIAPAYYTATYHLDRFLATLL